MISKLSDVRNPETAPAWFAGLMAALVVLMVWRCLVPQGVALWRSWRAERRHRRHMAYLKRKAREGLPPGRY